MYVDLLLRALSSRESKTPGARVDLPLPALIHYLWPLMTEKMYHRDTIALLSILRYLGTEMGLALCFFDDLRGENRYHIGLRVLDIALSGTAKTPCRDALWRFFHDECQFVSI